MIWQWFYHSITEFFDYWRSNLPFSRKSHGKKEKSVVSFTHGQNIICSQTLKAKTRLDDIAHEQNIISCRQLFEGYVVGFRQIMEEKFASNDKCRYCSFIQFQVSPSPRPGTFQVLAVFSMESCKRKMRANTPLWGKVKFCFKKLLKVVHVGTYII